LIELIARPFFLLIWPLAETLVSAAFVWRASLPYPSIASRTALATATTLELYCYKVQKLMLYMLAYSELCSAERCW